MTLIILTIFTVYTAVWWWSSSRDDGGLVRLVVTWAGAALSCTNAYFVMKRLGDRDSRRLFRRALKDGFAQPGVDTSRWRTQLESALLQSDDRWTAASTIYTGALGGILLVSVTGPPDPGSLALAVIIGVAGGAVLAVLVVWQQRRSRRRVVTLLRSITA